MSIRTSPWPNGVPCWADVSATDVRASGALSTAVLGWTVPEPDEQWGGYVTAEARGTPSHWLVSFQVADADAATAAAEQAGGTVVAPPVDTPFGRMACLADPDGATFMVMTTDPAQPGPDRSG